MPRYSIPNVPTAIDFSYLDPGNFGVKWGIYIYTSQITDIYIYIYIRGYLSRVANFSLS